MKDYLKGLPAQLDEGLRLGRAFARKHTVQGIDHVLFCGLGGSAISGDILSRLALRDEKYPFMVLRTPIMPKWVGKSTLVILSSFSGNTQEVLELFNKAVKAHAKILIVTSGGTLAKRAEKHKIPYVRIPGGIPPRCAVGYLTFALIPVLRKHKIIQAADSEIAEVNRTLKRTPTAEARRIAKKLHGRTVRFYGFTGILDPAVVRWKAQLAENSKIIASSCFLPEMFHNEIEGWQFPKAQIRKTTAVFFVDKDDPKKLQEKKRISQRIIRQAGAVVMEVKPRGTYPLSRIFSLVYLGDWVSYELALLHGADPLTIPAIDQIKKAG